MAKRVELIVFPDTLVEIAAEKFRSPLESVITLDLNGGVQYEIYSLGEAAYDTFLESGELELLTSVSAINALAKAARRKVKKSNRIIEQRRRLVNRLHNPVH